MILKRRNGGPCHDVVRVVRGAPLPDPVDLQGRIGEAYVGRRALSEQQVGKIDVRL
jgi:hypothetical protein